MPIQHSPKTGNFTQMDNDLVNDSRLSFRARGIAAYLLSKPADWTFSAESIASQSKDGRKAVLSALTELRNLGYLHTVAEQGDGGRWTKTNTFTEVPSRNLGDRTSVDGTSVTGLSSNTDTNTDNKTESNTVTPSVTTTDILSVTNTDVYGERATDETRETTPSPVKTWRSAMEANEQFQSLDALRRSILGVDDTVRECDYEAFLKAWQDLRVYSDDDADSIKGLTEIVVGAARDDRGIEKRRQFATWDELLDTTNGERDRCRAWFVIHELDETPPDDFDIKVRANQVKKAGTMTGLQFRTLGERHPLILDAVQLLTKTKSAESR